VAALRHPDLPAAVLDGPAREVKLLSDCRRELVRQILADEHFTECGRRAADESIVWLGIHLYSFMYFSWGSPPRCEASRGGHVAGDLSGATGPCPRVLLQPR
jgi:hypothetical protein